MAKGKRKKQAETTETVDTNASGAPAEEAKPIRRTITTMAGAKHANLFDEAKAKAAKLGTRLSTLVWFGLRTVLDSVESMSDIPVEFATVGGGKGGFSGSSPGFWVSSNGSVGDPATVVKVVEVLTRTQGEGRTFYRYKYSGDALVDGRARLRAQRQATAAAKSDLCMLGLEEDCLELDIWAELQVDALKETHNPDAVPEMASE
ncbi:MAG: hypothetical protein GY835_22680 [bacterium]|nr:hypothetical protein [bacterium]